ncbi:hypothetical protein D3C80_1085330 [compost metagenome]
MNLAPGQVQVEADLRTARPLLGLDRIAAGAVDLDHVHLHHPVRAGQVGRDLGVVDVQVAAQLDIAIGAPHGGQHPVGAGLGDVVVDDAEAGQLQPQGRTRPLAQAQIAVAAHRALDPVGGLEAFDHGLAVVEAAGQGDAFEAQTRGAVAESALGQVHAAVQPGGVQRAGQGGAGRDLTGQGLRPTKEEVPDGLNLAVDGDLAGHVAGAGDSQAQRRG